MGKKLDPKNENFEIENSFDLENYPTDFYETDVSKVHEILGNLAVDFSNSKLPILAHFSALYRIFC